jgi:hypothetical protein
VSLDDELQRIVHKSQLRDLIDGLDDDTQGVILTWSKSQDGYKFNVYGGATVAEAVYACETFKSFLING